MKASKTPVKYHLGIPVSKLVQGIIFSLLCIVLLVVEIRYHHAKPGEAAIAKEEAEQAEAVKSFEAYSTAQTAPENLINEQTVIFQGEAVADYTSPYKMDFGRPEDYKAKFSRMEDYYRYIYPAKQEMNYKTVNVKYDGQIICRK